MVPLRASAFAIAKVVAAEDARVTVNGRTEASLPVSATVMKTRFKKQLMKLSSNSKNK